MCYHILEVYIPYYIYFTGHHNQNFALTLREAIWLYICEECSNFKDYGNF